MALLQGVEHVRPHTGDESVPLSAGIRQDGLKSEIGGDVAALLTVADEHLARRNMYLNTAIRSFAEARLNPCDCLQRVLSRQDCPRSLLSGFDMWALRQQFGFGP